MFLTESVHIQNSDHKLNCGQTTLISAINDSEKIGLLHLKVITHILEFAASYVLRSGAILFRRPDPLSKQTEGAHLT